MKILFVNEYASPNIVSGAERSMKALSEALNKKTTIFTLSPNLSPMSMVPQKRETLPVGEKKFPFPKKISPGKTLTPLWFNNPFFWLYAAYWIAKKIKNHQINLIHVHGKYIQPAAIIAGWLTKTPVVTTVRDFKFLCPTALCFTNKQKTCSFKYHLRHEIPEYLARYAKPPVLKSFITIRLTLAKLWQYILKWFLSKSNQVIAVSPQLKDIYVDNGIKNTISIYNLPPKIHPATKSSSKQKIILSIGKLSFGKGTDTLLQAAQNLPEYKFILAGPKNISLKTSMPKNVQYLGTLPHQEALELFKKADVFIINSRWPEPLSRAGLEALSFGLPIIASNRGGNRQLIKNNGFLVNPDKPKEIAEAVKKIFKLNLSILRKNSHLLFKTRFNQTNIINKHLKLYQKLT